MIREIKTHAVNGLNEGLQIRVMDDPGEGGASYLYDISKLFQIVDVAPFPVTVCSIRFQRGSVEEAGINGISNEALLAVVRDRLECFQTGPFACDDNSTALMHVVAAMKWLHERTTKRIARGVEGTHQV